MKLVVAVLALTLFGCAAGPRPSHYTVAISPMFTADEQEAIVRGLDSWTEAVKELTIDVAVNECRTDALCVLPVSLAGVSVGQERDHSSNVLAVDVAKAVSKAALAKAHGLSVADVLARTVAHELGHIMLGPEHTGVGTLMAWDTLDQAQTPTATDIARWHEVR